MNAAVYSLPTTTLTFNVVPKISTTPEITDIELIQVTQTTATVTFTCSELSTAYYLVALDGTPLPSLAEFQSFGPAQYSTTQSQYGIYYVGQALTGTLQLKGLVAETPYIIWVLLLSRENLISQAPASISFNTTRSFT